ncbi:MAG TPA: GNAT family protein [Clostridium sp.]|uniref:GNAT family N-acetyltransferase n=1 Tax=Clostridium sp. TaxID=1506 RepID=UPI002F92A377
MKIIENKIFIRLFEDTDAEALLDLQLRNGEVFQKYSPTFSDDFYTLDSKRNFISNSIKQSEEGTEYSFGIYIKDNGKLIGGVDLFQIIRGPLQSCVVGYCLDKQYNGNGYVTEAVSLAIEFGFNSIKLHRIEAGVMPGHIASMRVLEKVGFHKEGIAQKNVKLNGRWEDHQIFAIISDNN